MQREVLSYVLNANEQGERIITMRPPKARIVREAIELYEEIFTKNSVKTADKLDEVLSQVVAYWGDLSVDDIYDGLPSDRLFLFIRETLEYIVSGTTQRIEEQKKLQSLKEIQGGQYPQVNGSKVYTVN